MGFWSTMGSLGGAAAGTFLLPGVGTKMGAAIGGGLGSLADDDPSVEGFIGGAAQGYGAGAAAETLAPDTFASAGGPAAIESVAPAGVDMAGAAGREAGMASITGPDMAVMAGPTPNAALMASNPDSSLTSFGSAEGDVPYRMPESKGLTSLEKAFMISQIGGTAMNMVGGIQSSRRHNQQSRAGGDTFGRMLRDNMRATY